MLLRAQYVKDKSENRAVTAYDGRLMGSPIVFLSLSGYRILFGVGRDTSLVFNRRQ